MESYSVKFKDPSSYSKRIRASNRVILYIVLGMFFFWLIVDLDWRYSLVFSILILIVQLNKAYRHERYFIMDFEILNKEIKIRYKDENDEKEISGSKSDFKLKKKYTFSKGGNRYLAVYFQNILIIRQFEIAEWNDSIFDELISVSNSKDKK